MLLPDASVSLILLFQRQFEAGAHPVGHLCDDGLYLCTFHVSGSSCYGVCLTDLLDGGHDGACNPDLKKNMMVKIRKNGKASDGDYVVPI